ncbi:hypothetical protein [Dactylosporangium sp. CA-092794]|uniref:hypothetical protein n=1 Tax=Dactylosporangium sp. CA-092794 TaxID=3239929 RepID=UPI003D908A76
MRVTVRNLIVSIVLGAGVAAGLFVAADAATQTGGAAGVQAGNCLNGTNWDSCR